MLWFTTLRLLGQWIRRLLPLAVVSIAFNIFEGPRVP